MNYKAAIAVAGVLFSANAFADTLDYNYSELTGTINIPEEGDEAIGVSVDHNRRLDSNVFYELAAGLARSTGDDAVTGLALSATLGYAHNFSKEFELAGSIAKGYGCGDLGESDTCEATDGVELEVEANYDLGNNLLLEGNVSKSSESGSKVLIEVGLEGKASGGRWEASLAKQDETIGIQGSYYIGAAGTGEWVIDAAFTDTDGFTNIAVGGGYRWNLGK